MTRTDDTYAKRLRESEPVDFDRLRTGVNAGGVVSTHPEPLCGNCDKPTDDESHDLEECGEVVQFHPECCPWCADPDVIAAANADLEASIPRRGQL